MSFVAAFVGDTEPIQVTTVYAVGLAAEAIAPCTTTPIAPEAAVSTYVLVAACPPAVGVPTAKTPPVAL